MTTTDQAQRGHGNPGWRMSIEFCVRSESTLYEADGSVSEDPAYDPAGEEIDPTEPQHTLQRAHYLRNPDEVWQINDIEYEAAEQC